MQPVNKPEAESEEELLDHVAREFIRGVKGDDHKGLMDALRALIANIQMQDQMQDEQEMSE